MKIEYASSMNSSIFFVSSLDTQPMQNAINAMIFGLKPMNQSSINAIAPHVIIPATTMLNKVVTKENFSLIDFIIAPTAANPIPITSVKFSKKFSINKMFFGYGICQIPERAPMQASKGHCM